MFAEACIPSADNKKLLASLVTTALEKWRNTALILRYSGSSTKAYMQTGRMMY